MARRPRAASWAMRAEVPVPHGLRSIAFLAIEHGVAPVRLGVARSPVHMVRDAAYGRIVGMDDFDGLVHPLPQDRAEPENVAGGQASRPP